MIITPLCLILHTASLILVAPPAVLPYSGTRLNLHSHRRRILNNADDSVIRTVFGVALCPSNI